MTDEQLIKTYFEAPKVKHRIELVVGQPYTWTIERQFKCVKITGPAGTVRFLLDQTLEDIKQMMSEPSEVRH